MSIIHRGYRHALCSHVGALCLLHGPVLRNFEAAESELKISSEEPRLDCDPDSLTWSDGALRHVRSVPHPQLRHPSHTLPSLELTLLLTSESNSYNTNACHSNNCCCCTSRTHSQE